MGRERGWHHTEEEKRRIGLASKRIGISAETRAKMVASRKSRGNYVFSAEHKQKLCDARRKRVITDETRAKLGATTRGHKYALGYRHTEETKIRMSQQRIGNQNSLGVSPSAETRMKLSKIVKATWSQSEEYKNKRIGNIIRGNKKSPNSKESAIMAMLDDIQPNAWYFIGNGKKDDVPINAFCGKMPDFWNGGYKFIEHYGAWWHRNHNPQERIDLFAKNGCKMLIIQEIDLMKFPAQVKSKIAEFVSHA